MTTHTHTGRAGTRPHLNTAPRPCFRRHRLYAEVFCFSLARGCETTLWTESVYLWHTGASCPSVCACVCVWQRDRDHDLWNAATALRCRLRIQTYLHVPRTESRLTSQQLLIMNWPAEKSTALWICKTARSGQGPSNTRVNSRPALPRCHSACRKCQSPEQKTSTVIC